MIPNWMCFLMGHTFTTDRRGNTYCTVCGKVVK